MDATAPLSIYNIKERKKKSITAEYSRRNRIALAAIRLSWPRRNGWGYPINRSVGKRTEFSWGSNRIDPIRSQVFVFQPLCLCLMWSNESMEPRHGSRGPANPDSNLVERCDSISIPGNPPPPHPTPPHPPPKWSQHGPKGAHGVEGEAGWIGASGERKWRCFKKII